MALKGSLTAFAPADIFQLVGSKHRSGMLKVTREAQSLEMWFQDGELLRVEARNRPMRDRLGMRLMRAGLLNNDKLEAALRSHKTMRRRLGTVLLLKGVLDADTLENVLRTQSLESVFSFLTWTDGSYEFTDGAAPPSDGATDLKLRWDNLLMEGLSRIDGWPALREQLPDLDVSFAVVRTLPPPPEGRLDESDSADDDMEAAFLSDDTGSSSATDEKIGMDEHVVFELVEAGVTAQQIIDRSLLGDFAGARALGKLVKLGFLKPAGRGEDVDF